VETERRAGRLTRGCMSVTQGGLFDRLQFLRGMENLFVDFATSPPELDRMNFHGDIGGQRGLLFSPGAFRRHLKPAYREVFMLCRRAGTQVSYSSDGCMLDLVDDLIDCGVTVHDPELATNTVAGIGRAYGGKLCAMIRLDAQRLPSWRPEEIRRHVRESVRALDDPRGGLTVYAYVGADVPVVNVGALCGAVEDACRLPRPDGSM
jgi:uroporphyrinogen decarboxylase